jgi:hypothetical protein
MAEFRTYVPTATLLKFHNDNHHVRGVVGPFGSGKSVGCALELLLRSIKQRPHTDGVRRSRWGIIRNTFPELRSTTMKTVKDWLPDSVFTTLSSFPITGTLDFTLDDGTRVLSEWVFIAQDQPEDVKKLKSLELSGVWMNEASELTRETLDMAMSRIGRYPSMMQGGPDWSGIILDTNAPSEDSWWYELFEQEKPEGYAIFHQPPAVLSIADPLTGKPVWSGHPDAENIPNLKDGFDYYLRQIPGKSPAWINVFLLAKYGESLVGRPVFAGEFSLESHTTKELLKPDRSLPVLIGFDWGLYPAAVFGQLDRFGALAILYELSPDTDVSLESFLEDYLTPVIMEHFQGCTFAGYGDPAGRGRSQLDKRTPFTLVGQSGIRCTPVHTNDFLPRRDSVAGFLNRRDGFTLSSRCVKLRRALLKDYRYEKKPGGGGEFKTRPEKNMASHVADALQYLCLGIRSMNRIPVINRGGSDGQEW